MITEQSYSVAVAAKSLSSLLYKWKNKVVAKQQGVTLDELKRLRKENTELRMKKEILKRSAPSLQKKWSKI